VPAFRLTDRYRLVLSLVPFKRVAISFFPVCRFAPFGAGGDSFMTPSVPDDAEWAASMRDAVSALVSQDFATAANLYQQAVEVAERSALDDTYLAESLEGLAAARSRNDEAADVSDLVDRAREIRDRDLVEQEVVYGPVSLEVAECIDRCAFHRLRKKNPSAAIALYERALAIRESVLGELHFDVANTLMIMGGVYSLFQRDRDAAATLWRRAAELLERLHTNPETDSQDVAMSLRGCLENLAVHAFFAGEYDESESLFRRVVQVANESFGSGSCSRPCNPHFFARVLIRQQKYDEAEDMLKPALSRRSLPAGHREALVELYRATGRDEAADALEERSADGRQT
jgi:tetratricopeptide (TPR) repeat protein